MALARSASFAQYMDQHVEFVSAQDATTHETSAGESSHFNTLQNSEVLEAGQSVTSSKVPEANLMQIASSGLALQKYDVSFKNVETSANTKTDCSLRAIMWVDSCTKKS